MKKIVLFAAALLALGPAAVCVSPAWAGQTQSATQQNAHHRKGARMQRLAQELGLTDAQKTQIKTIMQNTRQQAQSIHKNSALSADQKKEQMQALHKSMRKQVAGVLTKEQKAKWQAIRQEHRAQKHSKNAPVTPSAPR